MLHSRVWGQVMTALAVAREALSREGQLEARLTALAQAASQRGQRFFTLPEARLVPCTAWLGSAGEGCVPAGAGTVRVAVLFDACCQSANTQLLW